MKATDLIIGDWILINNAPHKIQATDSIDAEIQADDELYYVGEDRYHSEDKIEGVPLTYEILKKNGWKVSEDGYEYLADEATIQCCLSEIRGCLNGIEIEYFKCEYAHQYQHLLRLCGLNELADNLKL